MIRSNPPWSDKILTKHWAALEARVGAKWMPQSSFDDPKLRKMRDRLAYVEGELVRLRARRDEFARIEANHPDLGWMDKVIAQYAADSVMLRPQIAKLEKRKPKQHGYREYGCGHYGCVMPTQTPGVVIKVTTDATEASFVAAYLSLPPAQRPVGIVPYHRLIAIRSESRLRRPVFVLWRDEASYVGNIHGWVAEQARDFEKEYYRRSYRTVERLVGNCLDAGRAIRAKVIRRRDAADLMKRATTLLRTFGPTHAPPLRKDGTAVKIAYEMAAFTTAASEMQSEPMGAYIGRALSDSLEAGLLLADVHLNNIGMPAGPLAEEIGMTPIVTDPGHAIALDDRYAGVQVEEL